MEIGPCSDNRPTDPAGRPGKTDPRESDRSQPKQDRVDLSDQARAKLAALADKALREEAANQVDRSKGVHGREETGGTGYDEKDIRRKLALQLAEKRRSENADSKSRVEAEDTRGESRIEQARRRLESGFYNTPDVKKAIAEKLVDELRRSADEPDES